MGPPQEEVYLEVVWKTIEELCKPQTNEIRARFDLLTSFMQGDHSVDERYNAVQTQINLARYPQETARILHRDIFGFCLKMKSLCQEPSMIAILIWTNSELEK